MQKTLPISLFSKSSDRLDGLQVNCKLCLKALNAARYANGYKHVQAEFNKINRFKRREFVSKVKSSFSCLCGESDPACLDFHHLNGKDKAIATMANSGCALHVLIAEMCKCCILCANCHRKLHFGSLADWDSGKIVPLDRKSIELHAE